MQDRVEMNMREDCDEAWKNGIITYLWVVLKRRHNLFPWFEPSGVQINVVAEHVS